MEGLEKKRKEEKKEDVPRQVDMGHKG